MSPLVPTGWRPDPARRFEQRYVVAGRWTRRVRCAGAEAVDPCPLDPATGTPEDVPVGGVDHDPRGPDGAWRDDPTGRFPQRWWDGRRWTRHVRSAGHVATDALAAPPAGRRGRLRRRGARDAGHDPTAPGWRPDPDGHGERWWDGHDWTAKRRELARRPRPVRRRGAWWSRRLRALLVALVVVLVVVLVVLLA